MTQLKRFRFVAALAMLSCALSCTSVQPNSTAAEEADYGQLELLNVTTTPGVDSLTFRGTFRNPFLDPVDGIRVIARVRQDPNETSPVLAEARRTLDTHLEAGASAPFEITLEIAPKTLANVGFYLHGFAIHRGGAELPISPVWAE